MTDTKANTEIGRVKRVFFGIDDRDMLGFYVDLDFGGSGQAYGGFRLDTWDHGLNRGVGTAAGCEIILELHRFFGVTELSKAVGQAVIAEREDGRWGATIVRLHRLPCDGGAVFDVKEIVARFPDAQKGRAA